ncbi:GNAT family N-acetyltransferase [Spirosoma flavum]|uniref:GNAT family N-acetyltransferase n=1 Tax=Spirosoma flavum TaxID=2048557 RepID=A0ABW6AN26_9BACT
MAITIRILPRNKINSLAWDACIANSHQRILYGYSWYLDIVLPAPFWKWVGAVIANETGQYQTVMPIPLRRKVVAGITCAWVVHQPFFCQFLGVFSRQETLDPMPFFRVMQQRFRYGSTVSMRQQPDTSLSFDTVRAATTHTLALSVGYDTIYQNYTHDRKQNLRRARREMSTAVNWTIVESTDPEPLLTLFRENHADNIDGGVTDWAYAVVRNLVIELSKRNLITLRYACCDGRIEAGTLFVQEGNRIIYLFNAGSEIGRRRNARTLLIDQMIREQAGHNDADEPLVFDFESPEKLAIREFYQSFGTSEEPFWEMRWNRLNPVENVLRRLLSAVRSGSKIF